MKNIKIKLKGATRSWLGAYLRNRFSRLRTRAEASYEKTTRRQEMNQPGKPLTYWLEVRLCEGNLSVKNAYMDSKVLTFTCGALRFEDLQSLMRTILITADDQELRLKSIGSDTYTVSDYGRDGDEESSTYSTVEVVFA